jgi:2-polyprenyl-3-methyl-5-hydroxy-6-metoxy-1,4-benzoquinol methylase
MRIIEKGSVHYNTRWNQQNKKDGLVKYNNRNILLHTAVACLLKPNDLVLEVGCGAGYFAINHIASICEDFLAVDFSDVAINIAKNNAPELNNKFKVLDVLSTDINSPNFFKYNTIVAIEFLEHTDFDIEFIKSINVGTKVIFSVPLNEREKKGMPGYPNGYPVHRRIYTESYLRERYRPFINIIDIKIVLRRPAKWMVVLGYSK